VANDIFLAQIFGLDDDVRHGLYVIREALFHLAKLANAQPQEEGDHRQTKSEAGPSDGFRSRSR
jgi:hypothetical protein